MNTLHKRIAEIEVDFMNQPLFTTFDRNAYWNAQSGEGDPPKKYMLKASGLVEGGPEDWNQYSYYVYCDLTALESVLKQIYRNKVVPGQPTQKNGKPYSDFCYETCTINGQCNRYSDYCAGDGIFCLQQCGMDGKYAAVLKNIADGIRRNRCGIIVCCSDWNC